MLYDKSTPIRSKYLLILFLNKHGPRFEDERDKYHRRRINSSVYKEKDEYQEIYLIKKNLRPAIWGGPKGLSEAMKILQSLSRDCDAPKQKPNLLYIAFYFSFKWDEPPSQPHSTSLFSPPDQTEPLSLT